MTLGVVILAHTALHRTAEIAQYWADYGCKVAIHIDAKTSSDAFDSLKASLSRVPGIHFAPRTSCTWGTWSLVKATIQSCEMLLANEPDVSRVLLTSGTCIPIRPARYLIAHLEEYGQTDFIESVTTADVSWAVSGLEEERFTLYFPFSWKKRRRLFDFAVDLQRKMGVRRRVPAGLVPHLGSQWWCLTRRTLEAIFTDPERDRHERYFKQVWIPDEGYFQTLVRKHSTKIESRSLTFAKFDAQGRPHTFYDDNLNLLAHSGYFLARKIWPNADQLYRYFLTKRSLTASELTISPNNVDQVLTKAAGRRQVGRPGLYMQSRFPAQTALRQKTAAPYLVLEGFATLFPEFGNWFTGTTGLRMHGHLFARDRVAFFGDAKTHAGGLTDIAALRDYDPQAFLSNLIWNTRGDMQVFHFGPQDRQEISEFIAADANARVAIITGAWALALHRADLTFAEKRRQAAVLQRTEGAHIEHLQASSANGTLLTITLEAALHDPIRQLSELLEHLGAHTTYSRVKLPELAPTHGLAAFLQALKNDGLRLHLVGDVRDSPAPTPVKRKVGT
ncbi:MAG: beta-1,6-N-acetylglucosaminyltransferase [Deltaproteobacteria bacterium]